MSELHTFVVEAERENAWERVATWQRFGMDEAEALAGTITAARREFPVDNLRVRPVIEDVSVVQLSYRCRDIGYGVEEGEGEYVYRGRPADALGKCMFEPIGGGESLYLFEDEIVAWTA